MSSIIKGLIDYQGVANKKNFPLCPKSFTQFTVQENLEIPSVKPDIEQVVRVVADASITYTKVIKTPISTSYEGQILTGRKLLVEGELFQKIEYVANEPTQSVHAAHFTSPFSTYIVLACSEYNDCSPITVVPYIENIYIHKIDSRRLFKNVSLFLHAIIN